MSRPEPGLPLGRKIATERQRRGLSQAQLAGLIGRSVAWVPQVEHGARTIDRISVLHLVARAGRRGRVPAGVRVPGGARSDP